MSDLIWGTITQVSPLRVQLDGDSAPILVTPASLIDPGALAVSDRVRCELANNRLVVLGRVGGGTPVFGTGWPAGTSIEGYWTAAPAGFLLEDGALLVRATYPALFTAIGTTYNTGGETSLQFRLPDSRGRAQVGKSAAGIFNTLGAKTGTETETLTTAQIPAHTHPNPAGGQYWIGGGTAIFAGGSTYSGTLSAVTGASTGGGGSHNNVQPSIVVNRAIKF